jgi:hypothetical protein
MNTFLDCIPCFARQALEATRFVTDDPVIHERVMRGILREAAEMDFSQSPPAIGQILHRALRELTGVVDPYREIKDYFNQTALEMLPVKGVKLNCAIFKLTLTPFSDLQSGACLSDSGVVVPGLDFLGILHTLDGETINQTHKGWGD